MVNWKDKGHLLEIIKVKPRDVTVHVGTFWELPSKLLK